LFTEVLLIHWPKACEKKKKRINGSKVFFKAMGFIV